MYTVDGGITWESAAPPLPAADRPTLRDVFFIDDQHGWVVGEEGTILATRDGGSTWVRQDTGLADARSAPKLEHIPRAGKVDVIDAGDRTPGLTLSAVRFVDRRRGWAAGYYAGLGRLAHTAHAGWRSDVGGGRRHRRRGTARVVRAGRSDALGGGCARARGPAGHLPARAVGGGEVKRIAY